ncbi:hypothetical protein [Paraburkholderia sp.]|jgi:hypothetical protein|uniref:hypothetical protein n=1 Tax=Paraburkholderia sp. TaxID=1926495 RepID=UPI002F3F5EBD
MTMLRFYRLHSRVARQRYRIALVDPGNVLVGLASVSEWVKRIETDARFEIPMYRQSFQVSLGAIDP